MQLRAANALFLSVHISHYILISLFSLSDGPGSAVTIGD